MINLLKKNCLSVIDFNTIITSLDKGKLLKVFHILINRNKRFSDLYFAQDNHYKRQMYDFIIRHLYANYFYDYYPLRKKRNELNFDELIREIESNFKNNPYYISIDKLN